MFAIDFNVNVVHGRTGSCYMEVGSTSVICSMYVKQYSFLVELCYVEPMVKLHCHALGCMAKNLLYILFVCSH